MVVIVARSRTYPVIVEDRVRVRLVEGATRLVKI